MNKQYNKIRSTRRERLVAGGLSALVGIGVALFLNSGGLDYLKEFNNWFMSVPSYTQDYLKSASNLLGF